MSLKYVLSTMGVTKESITKFLIGNRFHVKLRILSPYSNRYYLNKDWGCVILCEIDFLLKICWSIAGLNPSWKVHTWIEICASLNHRKKTKADGSRLIPRKNTETLVLLSEFKIIVKCSRLLRVSVFIHGFSHFKIPNIFQLENFLRFINVSNFTSHRFTCVQISHGAI